MTAVEVLRPGPLATIQDLGRPGFAGIGVGISGAADRGALRLANRLVGNSEDAAAIEITLGQLAMRARGDLTVAVTGAPCPITVGARHEAMHSLLRVADGAQLQLGPPDRGLRSYLAVRGGLVAAQTLGSRSTDLLSGLGPEPLRSGNILLVGPPPGGFPATSLAPVAALSTGDIRLEVVPGPRADWFTPEALKLLLSEPFTVMTDSNRVGMRLSGPVLGRSRPGELPSEGMVTGAIQVPPSGQPTLFLADHPCTGGYPVIAVVRSAHVDLAAQARPGQRLRFGKARDLLSAPAPRPMR